MQLTEDLPGFGNPVLRDEPAWRFWDPVASDEEDEGWNAGEGQGATPAECEIAGNLRLEN